MNAYYAERSVATQMRLARLCPPSKRPGLIVADWVEGCRAQGIELELEEIVDLVAVVAASQGKP